MMDQYSQLLTDVLITVPPTEEVSLSNLSLDSISEVAAEIIDNTYTIKDIMDTVVSPTDTNMRKMKLISSLIPSITDKRTLALYKNKLGDLLTMTENNIILNRIYKQQLILFSDYIQINERTGNQNIDLIIERHIAQLNRELRNPNEIPYEDLIYILRQKLVPGATHYVINELQDPYLISQLIMEEVLDSEIDKAVNKLDYESLVRLIQEEDANYLIDFIKDHNMLKQLFYDIDHFQTKATIARRLENSDLAFEVLQRKFDNEENYFLQSQLIDQLMIMLTKKQLMIFRLTAPSEIQVKLNTLIKQKEQRDRYDSEMFI